MGDPEAEVVLPRLENDLVGLFVAATQKELDMVEIRLDARAAATVVAVSNGYPTGYKTGYPIKGIDQFFGKQTLIFQAGTREEDGKVLTNGGRVLAVTSYGENIKEAVQSSLEVLGQIHYEGIYFREDIGHEFIQRSSVS